MAKKTITPFQQELIDTVKKISEYKLSCEANITAIIYLRPELLYETDLELSELSNNTWRVYWAIASDIIKKENKKVLDDMTIGFYLEKHPKLKAKYDEYGGYETIEKAGAYVKVENLEGYIGELRKWNSLMKMAKNIYSFKDNLSNYCDMSSEDIYNEQEAILNHIFINADEETKSYSIDDGIDELIDELNRGMAVGLPYNDMPLLNKETGGQLTGNITLIGGLSNMGKTTLARSLCIPTTIKNGDKLVIILNEEGTKKWQRELLVWVANNIYKFDLQKFVVRDGKYSDEVMEMLRKCADWIKTKASDNTITLIPFNKYRTDKAIKVIKKYASLGVKYFILDTFKADSGSRNDKMWLEMQQAMVDIYDTVKTDGGKDVHIVITFQLAKSSARQRFYSQDNIGQAKNIIDVASTCIMIRDIFDDEYTGEKNALKVYRLEGKNGKSKIPVNLDHEKHYQLLFIVKNREGVANSVQIVVEHDMSRNLLKEVGFTSVPVDF